MLFRRGRTWWYKFQFTGRTYRESTKTTNQRIAERAERQRRQKLEETYNGLQTERVRPKLFSVASDESLKLKDGANALKSYGVEVNSLKHLKPVFGQKLLTDIDAMTIARYVGVRRKEGDRKSVV